MFLSPDDLLKILLSVAVGGLIGLEREFRDKAAGFRTLIFICLGATLFTMLSVRLAGNSEPTRISANIVVGVGFLGAGVILREGGRVIGLTTAATIWLTAALGMGIGGGQFPLVGFTVLLAMIVLWMFPRLEQWLNNFHEEHAYEVVCAFRPEKFVELENRFREAGLRVHGHRQVKTGKEMLCTWQAGGPPQAHRRLVQQLFADEEVREFRF